MKALVCKSRLLLGALLTVAAGLGCSSKDRDRLASTGVGNPYEDPEPGTLALALVADDGSSSQSEEVTSLPRGALEQALLVLGRVTWLPCNSSEPSIVQEGPFVIDLVGGTTEPEFPVFRVPAGGMCSFEASLAPARDSAALAARSLYFAGTRADGVEFVLFANVRATLRMRAPGSVEWGTDDNLRLLWAMRPRRWAAPAELDMAEPRVWNDGRRSTIVIDANRHPLLLALIRARLASESSVFDDAGHDRVLGESERADEVIGTGSTEADD